MPHSSFKVSQILALTFISLTTGCPFALGGNICGALFTVQKINQANFETIRFSKQPASKEFLDTAEMTLYEKHGILGISRALDRSYQTYLRQAISSLSDVSKIPENEVADHPLLGQFLLHPIEFKMIYEYTDGLYKEINPALRMSQWHEWDLEISVINSALTRLRQESKWFDENASWLKGGKDDFMLVHRWYKLNTSDKASVDQFLDRYREGEYVIEEAFTSTTSTTGASDSLWITGNVLFKIRHKSGVYISTISSANKDIRWNPNIFSPP